MAFSLKKLQQRSRRQAAARRPPTAAAHPSILRKADHLHNSIRKVAFSATCTAKVYGKMSFPRTVARYQETEERMLPHVEEEAPQPVEEEEGVRFGNDVGRKEPAEPIARRTRNKRALRRREVALLSNDLGAYWSVTAPRVRRAPARFVPTV